MAAVQSWPEFQYPANRRVSAASSTSASSKTMTGALPPSSRCNRLTVSAAIFATRLPVTVSPVIEIMRTFGWPTSASPMSPPEPDRTLTTPGGKISAMISAKARADNGVRTDGLSTTVLPGRQGRAELPGRHVQRVVPRRDRGHDADRVAPDDRGVAGHELVGRQAVHDPRRAGEEAEQVDAGGHLVDGRPDRLAGVGALEPAEPVAALASRASASLSSSRERSWGVVFFHVSKAVVGGVHRPVDVLGGARRHAADDPIGRRVDDVHGLAVGGVHEVPADELLVGLDAFCDVGHLGASWAVGDGVRESLAILVPLRKTVSPRGR